MNGESAAMTHFLSTPLTDPPAFLSTISMVVDDGREIIRSLIAAERKSPPVYDPARHLFLVTLEGKLRFEEAIRQAHSIMGATERRCAIEILEAAEPFLRTEPRAPSSQLPLMDYPLANGLDLKVAPIWHRRTVPERLMVLHFWQTPLSHWQLSAAGAVIQRALMQYQPRYLSCELDLISIPLPERATRRRFERYDWAKIKPLNDEDLARFWRQFLTAWKAYRAQEPRTVRRRRDSDLFGSTP